MLSSPEALVLFGFLLSILWLLGAAHLLDTLFLSGASPFHVSYGKRREHRPQGGKGVSFWALLILANFTSYPCDPITFVLEPSILTSTLPSPPPLCLL